MKLIYRGHHYEKTESPTPKIDFESIYTYRGVSYQQKSRNALNEGKVKSVTLTYRGVKYQKRIMGGNVTETSKPKNEVSKDFREPMPVI